MNFLVVSTLGCCVWCCCEHPSANTRSSLWFQFFGYVPSCCSVAKLYPTLCAPMGRSTPGFPKLLDYMVIVCLIFWSLPTVFLEQVIFVGNMIPELPINISKFKGPWKCLWGPYQCQQRIFNCLAPSQCCRKVGGWGTVTNPILPMQQILVLGAVSLMKMLAIRCVLSTFWLTVHSLKFNNSVWVTRTLMLTGRNFSLSKSNMLAGLKGTYTG